MKEAPTLLSFSAALAALKAGLRVARSGWNGKGMWLTLLPGHAGPITAFGLKDLRLLPWIGMYTADGAFVPWLASQTDLLSDDWVVVDG